MKGEWTAQKFKRQIRNELLRNESLPTLVSLIAQLLLTSQAFLSFVERVFMIFLPVTFCLYICILKTFC